MVFNVPDSPLPNGDVLCRPCEIIAKRRKRVFEGFVLIMFTLVIVIHFLVVVFLG
ncbi:hypothetical protein GCM10007852_18810 [Agaribacter marinus]|uniref:Uncharacterized protein n=1 Tax=Agaribacter marinus TaxID=1431249 RepID=A0AA37T231_9ALTE|nr:hypothetical protein GCM10007852_18810 [Agaribacter marinus]